MKCGLLGRKLGHSYSPQIHTYLGDYSYDLFEKEPEDVADFLRNGDFTAINVTIPYKKDVIPYCAELSPRAQAMGAVNTIVRCPDGSLIGHNTDHFGFSSMVERSGLQPAGKKTLVLGSGGASNTAVRVLKEMGAIVVIISRHGEDNYDNLDRHSDASIIVNATPVGMYPHVGKSPLDLSLFPRLEGVLDMIYNPSRTKLLLDAEKRGLVAENGLWMLVAQAKEAAEWFTGSTISDSVIAQIHHDLRIQMENIILVGMPGCGKSTIAALLAEKLGRKSVDADTAIITLTEKSIPAIFAEYGEPGFRALETQALESLGMQSGLIIATGGGCVTQEQNYPLLHQNGTIFWLERDLNKLPTNGRPLSQANNLTDMYKIRKPMYERFADYRIDNNSNAETTVAQILTKLEESP